MGDVLNLVLNACDTYGYPVLFAVVFLENAGLPVPGETGVLVAGFLASPAGGERFHLPGVMAVTVLAAVLGDNMGFWLGREWARPRLQRGARFLFLTPRALRKAEGYFDRYGSWTIFFARFITGLRVVGALAAGTAGMPWPRFLLANTGGAIAWAATMSLLGYFFGHSLPLLHHWLGRTGLILLGAVVAVGLLALFGHRLRRHWAERKEATRPPLTEAPRTLEYSRIPEPQPAQQPSVEGVRMAEKVVIIGSGPAGWTAAIYAARANLQPLVFEGNALLEENRLKGTLPLGQLNLTTEVENFPAWPYVDAAALQQFSQSALPPDRYELLAASYYEGKQVHHGKRSAFGPELMEYMRQQAINFGTRIITDDIVRVELGRRPFRLTSLEGQTVETYALILATGARANYLGLPSEDRFKNKGVSACAVCDGALPRFRNKPLVVVGGGDSAVEEGTYLTKFASTVYLVHRRDQLRASKIMQQRVFDNPKITPKWNRVLDEVLGDDDPRVGVTGVRLRSTVDETTEELPVSGVFLAIGHTPNTEFLAGQVELDEKGYIRWTTPQRTHTSVEGVFAAGDVGDSYYRQAITAAGTGCMAALDAERWLAEKGHH